MASFDASALTTTDKDVSMSGVENSVASEELRSFVSSVKNSFVDRTMETRPGALVFFAGIPGCGKSTIVQGLEAKLKEVLHDREITCLEGDRIKKKYWAAVKSKRFENPAAILLADKNSPPSIWALVAEIASATQAIAIPVFHGAGALETTEVKGIRYPDGAMDTGVYHHYPFSLKYLAVCMSRVLDRQRGSHKGKLDISTPRACMIVLKFYALYRNQKAEEVDTIVCDVLSSSNAMIPPAIVRLPFFQDGTLADLPVELSEILHEALRCQVRSLYGTFENVFVLTFSTSTDMIE
jgi:energy-coupling factor transporter ATP-binding protein EcfA2